jgi:hypothetical protein
VPGGDGGLGGKGGRVRRGHGDSSSPLKARCSDVYIQTPWPRESLMTGKQEFSGEGGMTTTNGGLYPKMSDL